MVAIAWDRCGWELQGCAQLSYSTLCCPRCSTVGKNLPMLYMSCLSQTGMLQTRDQTWTAGNLALQDSLRLKVPVRVVRGSTEKVKYAHCCLLPDQLPPICSLYIRQTFVLPLVYIAQLLNTMCSQHYNLSSA